MAKDTKQPDADERSRASQEAELAAMRAELDRRAGRAAEDKTALLEAQVAALSAQVALLAAQANRPPAEPPNVIPPEWLAWAELPAQAKTQLVADKLFGPTPGARAYKVQLVYPDKEVAENGRVVRKPSPSEFPEVVLHAHSEDEAVGFYKRLCGITNTDKEIVATAAA